MKEIYNIIQENSKKTGNASGISTLQAWEASKLQLPEFVQHLDGLIKENKVVMREGINKTLLFTVNN